MAQRPPTIEFEDIPLDESRRVSRGLCIEPESYSALKQKIPSLDTTATRRTVPEHKPPTTMKNRILRVAAALGVPVTVSKALRGLLFWRSTDEDLQQPADAA